MKHLVVLILFLTFHLMGTTLKVVYHDMCPSSTLESLKILNEYLEDISFEVKVSSDLEKSLVHLRNGEIDVLITFNRFVPENFRKSLPLSGGDFILFGSDVGKIGTLKGFESAAFTKFGSDNVEVFEDLPEIEMLFSKRYLKGVFLPEGVFKKSDVETRRYNDQALCVMFFGKEIPDEIVDEINSSILEIYLKFSFPKSFRKIRIQIFDNPLYCYDEGEKVCGVDVKIIEKLFNRLGYTVDFVSYPPKRAFSMMRESRSIDGGFPMERNTFTEAFLRFVNPPLQTGSDVLFTLDDLREGFEPKEGMFKNCGFAKSYQNADIIEPFCRNKFPLDNLKLGMNLLRIGRIDALLENYSKGLREASNVGLKVTYSRPLRTYGMYLAISEKSPHVALVPFLEKALKNLITDH